MLQFLPAILLLVLNGTFTAPDCMGGFTSAERVILAMARADDGAKAPSEACPKTTTRLIVRALAWVHRWQSPIDDGAVLGESKRQAIFAPPQSQRLPLVVVGGDRSRDGPVA